MDVVDVIELEDLLFGICSILSMKNFLLNLGCNVSRYLSIQNEMAYFLNSWGILLNWSVTSNVTMSVSGSIFLVKKMNVISNIASYHV